MLYVRLYYVLPVAFPYCPLEYPKTAKICVKKWYPDFPWMSSLQFMHSMVKYLFSQTRFLRYFWRLLQPIMPKMGMIFTWPLKALFESQLQLRCLSKSIIVLLITLSSGQTTHKSSLNSFAVHTNKILRRKNVASAWTFELQSKAKNF